MNIFLTVNVLGFLITIQILQYVIIIYVKQMLSKTYWFISVIYTFGTQSNWNQMCELCHSGKLGSLQGLEWKLLRSYLPPLFMKIWGSRGPAPYFPRFSWIVGEDKNVIVFIQDPADYRACLNGITHTSGFNLIVFQKYILHL